MDAYAHAPSNHNDSATSDVSGVEDEEYHPNAFLAFKEQLEKVQIVINNCNTKIVDQTLTIIDLNSMEKEIRIMTHLEQAVTEKKMKSSYVTYKTKSLNMIQESYRICNSLMEKLSNEMDNIFDIDMYFNLIIGACAEKKDQMFHINTLHTNVLKSTVHYGLNFFGNIKVENPAESEDVTQQSKKQIRRSQKRPLEEQVVPVEVENDMVDNELKKNLIRIKTSLKKAVKKNQGKPISFHKFIIDPSSFTYSVENVFHLASLAKDHLVRIEQVSDDKNSEFTTITVVKSSNQTSSSKTDVSSLLTINYDLWKNYVHKYNINEQMIPQDE